jgi:16S rRNA (uracil1498-N3)-methyltransferase
MAAYDFRAPRLFVEAPLSPGAEVALDRDQANYLKNALRLKAGDAVLAFNGRDGEWRARLVASGRRDLALGLEAMTRPQLPAGDLALAFAPLKHARLDYLVQKVVEMGVTRLLPMITRHTAVARVNVDRMRANAIEAAEQCGILAVSVVEEPLTFARVVAGLPPEGLAVFCDEEAEPGDPLAALKHAPPGPVTLLIGPEGGFAEEERRTLLARERTVRLSLGPRVLRADTAAVAALALVQAVRGDWRRRV